MVSGDAIEESVAKFMETDANAQEKGMKGRNVIHSYGTVASSHSFNPRSLQRTLRNMGTV